MSLRARWDLDSHDAIALRDAWDELLGFVEHLFDLDLQLPECWYTHGWVVRRLAVFSAWHIEVVGAGATPREAASWWDSLSAFLHELEPLRSHRGAHPPAAQPWQEPVPIPSLAEAVNAAVQAVAARDGWQEGA